MKPVKRPNLESSPPSTCTRNRRLSGHFTRQLPVASTAPLALGGLVGGLKTGNPMVLWALKAPSCEVLGCGSRLAEGRCKTKGTALDRLTSSLPPQLILKPKSVASGALLEPMGGFSERSSATNGQNATEEFCMFRHHVLHDQ